MIPSMEPAPTEDALLGGRTPRAFLAQHWHKEAVLVRQAIPGFTGLFSRAELFVCMPLLSDPASPSGSRA